MKDHLAISFQGLIKRGSCKNIRKLPCKTCHNTSTRDIIKEVCSFCSDQENQQNIPKNITLVYPMLVSVLQAHNLELIN